MKRIIICLATLFFVESIFPIDHFDFEDQPKIRDNGGDVFEMLGIGFTYGLLAVSAGLFMWLNPDDVLVYLKDAQKIKDAVLQASKFSVRLESLLNGRRMYAYSLDIERVIDVNDLSRVRVLSPHGEEIRVANSFDILRQIRVKRGTPLTTYSAEEGKFVVSEYDKFHLLTYDISGKRFVRPIWVPEKLTTDIEIADYVGITVPYNQQKIKNVRIVRTSDNARELIWRAGENWTFNRDLHVHTISYGEDDNFNPLVFKSIKDNNGNITGYEFVEQETVHIPANNVLDWSFSVSEQNYANRPNKQSYISDDPFEKFTFHQHKADQYKQKCMNVLDWLNNDMAFGWNNDMRSMGAFQSSISVQNELGALRMAEQEYGERMVFFEFRKEGVHAPPNYQMARATGDNSADHMANEVIEYIQDNYSVNWEEGKYTLRLCTGNLSSIKIFEYEYGLWGTPGSRRAFFTRVGRPQKPSIWKS